MDYLPPALKYASARLNDFHTNTQRLEVISSSTAGPNTITTVQLSDNAVLDLRSFRMYARVACTAPGGGGANGIYGRLPEHVNYLIQKVEVMINGQSINHGHQQYNTVSKLGRIGSVSRDHDGSIDRALHHGSIIAADPAAAETADLVWTDWTDTFLGSSACRYLDTGLTGSITVRITWAPASVIVPQLHGDNTGLVHFGATAAAVTNAQAMSYAVTNISFDIATVQLDPLYQQMLRQRLAGDGVIEIPYREIYTFEQSGIASNTVSHNFFLSTRSLDKVMATFRMDNYQNVGVRARSLGTNVVLGDTAVSNYMYFEGMDAGFAAKYNFTVLNTPIPSYNVDNRYALSEIVRMHDKTSREAQGIMVTTQGMFINGYYAFPLCLEMPGQPMSLTSGLDCRGVNAQLSFKASGLTRPTANVNAQIVSEISSFVACYTKPVLKIAPGRVCFPEL